MSDRKQVLDLKLVDRIHDGSVLRRALSQASAVSSSIRIGRVQRLGWNHARCPHHVENTRGEAEQQKHNHSPRRDSEPAIDQPADRRTDQDPGHELGREPKATRDRRRIGGRALTQATFGRTVGMDVAEPFAETLEPRGERSLVRRRLFAIASFACVVGHASTPATVQARSRYFRRPKAARTILTGSTRVRIRALAVSPVNQIQILSFAKEHDRLVLVASRGVWGRVAALRPQPHVAISSSTTVMVIVAPMDRFGSHGGASFGHRRRTIVHGQRRRRDLMIRMALFTLAGIALVGPAAWAQSPPPEGADSRYTFHRVDDGYVRLDGRTGQVSMCAQRPVGLGVSGDTGRAGCPGGGNRASSGRERRAQEGAHRDAICRFRRRQPEAPAARSGRRGCNCPTMPISIRSSTSLRRCGAASSR